MTKSSVPPSLLREGSSHSLSLGLSVHAQRLNVEVLRRSARRVHGNGVSAGKVNNFRRELRAVEDELGAAGDLRVEAKHAPRQLRGQRAQIVVVDGEHGGVVEDLSA
jgi:hypothetical protein